MSEQTFKHPYSGKEYTLEQCEAIALRTVQSTNPQDIIYPDRYLPFVQVGFDCLERKGILRKKTHYEIVRPDEDDADETA